MQLVSRVTSGIIDPLQLKLYRLTPQGLCVDIS